ncbi:MAG TPA: class I adenylate-forming enzyme family protein [Gordonia sp. (in: high G+C Gram-positive bacteria)]|uniref:class I adenylate-forming enzyme family protein n=1 Tax=unclassified Gordonia (in: high G+C Gram-positive bacteria) TaxID=2657482 RepID=UPI0025BE40DB|nr:MULTISPECIES: class I adenylate-forming enzyme family protein [unclassified Gordonia (in: high G+C Gram-positive bacteria)]HNP57261.1 class I adenylate-forming enzyme family protein [Gordonia sp. (in: high G+C Gram-positive bacteria)]HRC49325.1 class I adenylate-forming enzyme family protein [Gordonia sp. (in: high G+C Gram-positive bacteria)]
MTNAETRGLHPQSRIDDYLAKGWWSTDTLDDAFRRQVARQGDRLSVVDPANREALVGSPPRRLTWNELDAEVTALAARLSEAGVGRGDVVGMQLPNSIELLEVYLAAWRLGAAVSPLAMQYREREVVEMAASASFVAFITVGSFGDRRPAAEVMAVRDQIPSLEAVVTFGDPSEDSGTADMHWEPRPATDDEVQRVAAAVAADPGDPNDAATICWTSGTEGKPKGVRRAHYDWIGFSPGPIDGPAITDADILLNPFPMINMAGINGMLLPWLLQGATLVQHHPFDPQTFFMQIAVERPTYTLVPPALLWQLLNNEELLAKVDLSSLTRVGSGSAPLQPAMVRGWQQKMGLSVINFFGSNEGVALLSSPEDFPDPDNRARFFPRYGAPGVEWSGRITERVQIKLIDLASGAEITEPGIPGELRVGGPGVFPGYLHADQLASPFDDEGMLRSGDMFEIDGDRNQFLRYVDRCKDLVIRGGMNIAPAEVEALISEHPAVAEVAVVGYADEQMGERVAAVVVPRPGAELALEELNEFLRAKKIASFKLPEHLEIRDVLPRNEVGKILKRELRK